MSPSSLECTNCNISANWLQYFCLPSPSSVAPSSSPPQNGSTKTRSILPGLNEIMKSLTVHGVVSGVFLQKAVQTIFQRGFLLLAWLTFVLVGNTTSNSRAIISFVRMLHHLLYNLALNQTSLPKLSVSDIQY